MSNKLRLDVPFTWVLFITLIVATHSLSSSLSLQFWSPPHTTTVINVNCDNHTTAGDCCTVFKQSCFGDICKMNLTSEQRQVVKKLYRNGGKVERSKAHINFISKKGYNTSVFVRTITPTVMLVVKRDVLKTPGTLLV